jgi:hypothetical protein
MPTVVSVTTSVSSVVSGVGVRPLPPAPDTIAGLVHWVKADAAVTLWQDAARTQRASANNDPVGAWDDLSSSNVPFTQASSANRAVLRTGAQNGLPMVHFDAAASQYLTANAIAAYLTGSSRPVSWFVLFRYDTLTGGPILISAGSSTNAVPYAMTGIIVGTNQGFDTRGDTGTPPAIQVQDGAADTSAHSLVLSFAGTSVSIWVDGAAVITNAACDRVQPMTVNQWAMGALLRTTLSRPLTGFIGEYGLYSRAISSVEAVQVSSYLRARWATP